MLAGLVRFTTAYSKFGLHIGYHSRVPSNGQPSCANPNASRPVRRFLHNGSVFLTKNTADEIPPVCELSNPCYPEEDDMDEIAAHISARCPTCPCDKVSDPTERFIKSHVGGQFRSGKLVSKQKPTESIDGPAAVCKQQTTASKDQLITSQTAQTPTTTQPSAGQQKKTAPSAKTSPSKGAPVASKKGVAGTGGVQKLLDYKQNGFGADAIATPNPKVQQTAASTKPPAHDVTGAFKNRSLPFNQPLVSHQTSKTQHHAAKEGLEEKSSPTCPNPNRKPTTPTNYSNEGKEQTVSVDQAPSSIWKTNAQLKNQNLSRTHNASNDKISTNSVPKKQDSRVKLDISHDGQIHSNHFQEKAPTTDGSRPLREKKVSNKREGKSTPEMQQTAPRTSPKASQEQQPGINLGQSVPGQKQSSSSGKPSAAHTQMIADQPQVSAKTEAPRKDKSGSPKEKTISDGQAATSSEKPLAAQSVQTSVGPTSSSDPGVNRLPSPDAQPSEANAESSKKEGAHKEQTVSIDQILASHSDNTFYRPCEKQNISPRQEPTAGGDPRAYLKETGPNEEKTAVGTLPKKETIGVVFHSDLIQTSGENSNAFQGRTSSNAWWPASITYPSSIKEDISGFCKNQTVLMNEQPDHSGEAGVSPDAQQSAATVSYNPGQAPTSENTDSSVTSTGASQEQKVDTKLDPTPIGAQEEATTSELSPCSDSNQPSSGVSHEQTTNSKPEPTSSGDLSAFLKESLKELETDAQTLFSKEDETVFSKEQIVSKVEDSTPNTQTMAASGETSAQTHPSAEDTIVSKNEEQQAFTDQEPLATPCSATTNQYHDSPRTDEPKATKEEDVLTKENTLSDCDSVIDVAVDCKPTPCTSPPGFTVSKHDDFVISIKHTLNDEQLTCHSKKGETSEEASPSTQRPVAEIKSVAEEGAGVGAAPVSSEKEAAPLGDKFSEGSSLLSEIPSNNPTFPVEHPTATGKVPNVDNTCQAEQPALDTESPIPSEREQQRLRQDTVAQETSEAEDAVSSQKPVKESPSPWYQHLTASKEPILGPTIVAKKSSKAEEAVYSKGTPANANQSDPNQQRNAFKGKMTASIIKNQSSSAQQSVPKPDPERDQLAPRVNANPSHASGNQAKPASYRATTTTSKPSASIKPTANRTQGSCQGSSTRVVKGVSSSENQTAPSGKMSSSVSSRAEPGRMSKAPIRECGKKEKTGPCCKRAVSPTGPTCKKECKSDTAPICKNSGRAKKQSEKQRTISKAKSSSERESSSSKAPGGRDKDQSIYQKFTAFCGKLISQSEKSSSGEKYSR